MHDVHVTWDQFPNYGIRQYSRPHLHTMMDAGTFPPPVRLSANRIAWSLVQLDRWRATRPVADEPAPQLWPVRPPKPGRGSAGHPTTRPVGRQRGSRVVIGPDGKRRVVRPEASDAAAA